MTKEELKNMLKQNLTVKIFSRFDGSVERDGVKIQLDFANEELCSFFLWKEDNAGFNDIEANFWNEEENNDNI